jgi:hypothetical protein
MIKIMKQQNLICTENLYNFFAIFYFWVNIKKP